MSKVVANGSANYEFGYKCMRVAVSLIESHERDRGVASVCSVY